MPKRKRPQRTTTKPARYRSEPQPQQSDSESEPPPEPPTSHHQEALSTLCQLLKATTPPPLHLMTRNPTQLHPQAKAQISATHPFPTTRMKVSPLTQMMMIHHTIACLPHLWLSGKIKIESKNTERIFHWDVGTAAKA